jgi:hypothetical protein
MIHNSGAVLFSKEGSEETASVTGILRRIAGIEYLLYRPRNN